MMAKTTEVTMEISATQTFCYTLLAAHFLSFDVSVIIFLTDSVV